MTTVGALAARPRLARLRGGRSGWWLGVVLALLVATVIPAVGSAFWISVVIAAVIYALPIAGTGILYGRLGIVSLCQAALFAVGAWSALRIGFATHLAEPLVLVLAGLVTAAIGLLLGLVTVRLKGLYFALVSLMAAGAVQVFLVAKGFPNGGSGFLGATTGLQAQKVLPRPSFARTDGGFLVYATVVTLVLLLLCMVILRSRIGRAWALMRVGDECATSAGVNVAANRLLGLGLSSFITGIGGALLAVQIGSLNAASFYASESVVLFAVALLGGSFTLAGAVFGAIAYQILPAELTRLSVNGNASLVVFGVGLLTVLAVAPTGIAGLVGETVGKFGRGDALGKAAVTRRRVRSDA